MHARMHHVSRAGYFQRDATTVTGGTRKHVPRRIIFRRLLSNADGVVGYACGGVIYDATERRRERRARIRRRNLNTGGVAFHSAGNRREKGRRSAGGERRSLLRNSRKCAIKGLLGRTGGRIQPAGGGECLKAFPIRFERRRTADVGRPPAGSVLSSAGAPPPFEGLPSFLPFVRPSDFVPRELRETERAQQSGGGPFARSFVGSGSLARSLPLVSSAKREKKAEETRPANSQKQFA